MHRISLAPKHTPYFVPENGNGSFPTNGLFGEVYFRNLAAVHDGREIDGY